jgi:integrase
MGMRAKELSALAVAALSAPGMYAVGGVDGLYLQLLPTGGRTWLLRAMIGGRRREAGLGGYPELGLADARKAAKAMRALIREGKDPIAERQAAKGGLKAAQGLTFDYCAARYVDTVAHEWRNPKHRLQWEATLHQYASPVIGQMPIKDVGFHDVLKVLAPIWTTKTETASRLRGRIEAVLAWATVHKYRSGDNPATWTNNLDKVLAKPAKVKDERHHPALQIAQAGAFMADIRQREGMGALCLQFAMLTACRSGEARGATWAEIDGAMWTVPARRMKAGREHRQPLSDAALQVLEQAKALGQGIDSDYCFPAARGGALSDMALSMQMRRMGYTDKAGALCVPHGLRSTFRDWCSENTAYPREVIEAALAHTRADKTEAAYARSDLIEKRARLLNEWADFCNQVRPAVGQLLPMRRS